MLLALAGAAFCAGTETGFISVSRPRVMSLERTSGKEAKRARALAKVLSDTSGALTTLLIGNNICSVVFSTSAAALAIHLFTGKPAWMVSVWTLMTAVLMLFVGEYLPKLMLASRPLRRLLSLIKTYRVMAFILAPVSRVFSIFVGLIFRIKRSKRKRLMLSRDGLRLLVADRNDSTRLTQFERRLIDRVLMLQAATAGSMAHPSADGALPQQLSINAATRGDDILPIMRRAHESEAAVIASDGSVLGVVTEEDVLLALTGVLKESE